MQKNEPTQKLLTIKQARKVLGALAQNVSDETLEREIKVAQMLKTLYFSNTKSINAKT